MLIMEPVEIHIFIFMYMYARMHSNHHTFRSLVVTPGSYVKVFWLHIVVTNSRQLIVRIQKFLMETKEGTTQMSWKLLSPSLVSLLLFRYGLYSFLPLKTKFFLFMVESLHGGNWCQPHVPSLHLHSSGKQPDSGLSELQIPLGSSPLG